MALHAHTKHADAQLARFQRQLKGDREQLRRQCDRNVARMIRTQEVR